MQTVTNDTTNKGTVQKKKDKPYVVPKPNGPIFPFVKCCMRFIYKRPTVVSVTGELPSKAIIVSNHSSKKGPVNLELYFPSFFVPWGAHEMLGDYASRRAYLRDVYYIKKKGYGKTRASLYSGIEALFSGMIYKGMRFLPTFPDVRLTKTVTKSMQVLDADASVLIFPENSNEGYKEVLTEFFPGFVILAEQYFRKTGVDVPVFPVYYHDERRVIVIGEPVYVQDYVKQGMNRKQIAEEFRVKVNDLFFKYVQNDEWKKMKAEPKYQKWGDRKNA